MGDRVDRRDVCIAAERISGYIRRTPMLSVEASALGTPAPILLKLEQTQLGGSFKARGAFNRILAARGTGQLPPVGVVAASGGNHAIGVAAVANRLDVPATVFVPETAPAAKVAALRDLGVAVRQVGNEYAHAYEAAVAHGTQTGALFVHAYDQPEVVAGAGTLGLELLADAEFDTVLVAVGGGALVAGIALAVAGQARVVAVEPEGCPTMYEAIRAGEPVDVAVGGIASDALGARRIGELGLEIAQTAEVPSLLVSSEAILDAQKTMWEALRLVVEPSAAVALAALRSGVYQPQSGERVAVVVCGANTTGPPV